MSTIRRSEAGGAGARKLIVLFHGFMSRKKFGGVVDLARETFGEGAVYHAPRLPHDRYLSRVRAAAIVADQIRVIDRLCREHDIDEIVLVGHSMGAVIARRLLIEASGLAGPRVDGGKPPKFHGLEEELVEPPEEGEPPREPWQARRRREWAKKIKRLVLIAGMSRGWSIDNAKSGTMRLVWTLGAAFGHLLGGRQTIFDIRRGAPFIVQTRLRWIEHRRRERTEREPVQVIQLLGTVDQMVAPNDSVDYADVIEEPGRAIGDETGRVFRLVEVPASDHSGLIRLKPGRGRRSSPRTCEVRRKILRAAMMGEGRVLTDHEIRREHLDDELPPPPNEQVRNVVFVIHGIRDHGHWTKKIAARIKELDSNFVSRTPGYGYFPILPFILPWYRRHKVEWLMDHYVEARAAYPEAEFHYMGHSNGTYLCARALEDYPAASFKRIMFAGSVVRSSYDWRRLILQGRVDSVYNAVATRDYVVAVFPFGLRLFERAFDLGGAGHHGFEAKGVPEVFQLDFPPRREFVRGGHSAGRQESQWDEIAEFIALGKRPGPGNQDFSRRQPWLSRLLGAVSPGIVIGLALVLVGLLAAMAIPIFSALVGVDLIGPVARLLGALPPWLQNPWGILPKGVAELWLGWSDLGAAVHLVSLLVYVAVVRFIALRF